MSVSIPNTQNHSNTFTDQEWCHHKLYEVFFLLVLIAQTTKGVILNQQWLHLLFLLTNVAS